MIIVQVSIIAFGQQVEEKYNIHEGEDAFYLLMPVSEVYKKLGNPDEIQRNKPHDYNHNYDTVILYYSGIAFTYFDYTDDPEVLVITLMLTDKNYRIGNLSKKIGCHKDEIINKNGEPHYRRTINENIYFGYEINLRMPYHIVLEFRFNILGICDQVSLIHSLYYV